MAKYLFLGELTIPLSGETNANKSIGPVFILQQAVSPPLPNLSKYIAFFLL